MRANKKKFYKSFQNSILKISDKVFGKKTMQKIEEIHGGGMKNKTFELKIKKFQNTTQLQTRK